VGIVLGILLPRIHSGAMVPTARTVEVLGAVGFGILGLVSVIFSLLFLVVQSSNTTFTPRLNLFQADPWIWRTFAFALGLFAYSMSAFLAIGGAQEVSVVVPIFAFAAALTIIALIRNIQVKAFASLQVNTTIDSLQRSGRKVIDALYQAPPAAPADSRTGPTAPPGGRPLPWGRTQTTLVQLDLGRLLATAERADAVVVFVARVGDTLWEGSTVAEVHGDLEDSVVLGACVTGVNRTFDQDALLAFRLLSDIGLRALSPAVNDPATAVQALEAIVGLLSALSGRDLAVGALDSPAGVTWVYLAVPSWSEFVGEGLDELLAAARGSALVLARAADALDRLAAKAPPERRPVVERRVGWVRQCLRASGGPRPDEPAEPAVGVAAIEGGTTDGAQ
jgi:uncharacterized membrane protein